MKIFFVLFLLFQTILLQVDTPVENLSKDLQRELQEIIEAYPIPGITLAVRLDGDQTIRLAAGDAEKGKKAMVPSARMLGGSTGKMYVSAILLQLIQDEQLQLTDLVAYYLGEKEWYKQVPNADKMTIQHLMQHTSGLPRYIFQPQFMLDIKSNPLLNLSPGDCIAYILDQEALFVPGGGFAYSDTNYLLLGMIIEKLTGTSYNDLLRRFLLQHGLSETRPSDSRILPGLVQGYIGSQNFFSLPLELLENGELQINPAFEWTGGGTVTTAGDLATLAYIIHNQRIIDSLTYEVFTSPVNMRTGRPSYDGYGLGTFVWSQGGDLRYGHSGFFPGYQSIVEYSTTGQYSLALQINTDDQAVNLRDLTYRLDKIIRKHLPVIDEQKILENFNKQEECWNDQDLGCYMQAYAPHGRIQTASRGGITYGYHSILENYQKYFPKDRMGTLYFDQLKLRRFHADLYHVTGRFNLKFSGRDELTQGWFSATLEKIQGKWYMITDHSS